MTILALAILVLNGISGAVLIWHALLVLNAMTHRTCHCMRVVFILLAIGGATLLDLVVMQPDRATWQQTLIVVGVAVYLVVDRRLHRRSLDCQPGAA